MITKNSIQVTEKSHQKGTFNKGKVIPSQGEKL